MTHTEGMAVRCGVFEGKLTLLTHIDDAQVLIAEVLPWVYEAGNPYFDWLLGSPHATGAALQAMMRDESSEIAIWRACVLLEGERPIGGFIALAGRELPACRRADFVTMMKELGNEAMTTLRERLAESTRLFPPVDPNDFYLSKIGLLPAWRGRGLGHLLMREYLASGTSAGFTGFRLDVSAGNSPAVHLYQRSGFEIAKRTDGAAMSYLAMRLLAHD
jgi:ribosomal protein S18 acetylase RimI-like enzyme